MGEESAFTVPRESLPPESKALIPFGLAQKVRDQENKPSSARAAGFMLMGASVLKGELIPESTTER
jgi:hypothetical protein